MHFTTRFTKNCYLTTGFITGVKNKELPFFNFHRTENKFGNEILRSLDFVLLGFRLMFVLSTRPKVPFVIPPAPRNIDASTSDEELELLWHELNSDEKATKWLSNASSEEKQIMKGYRDRMMSRFEITK